MGNSSLLFVFLLSGIQWIQWINFLWVWKGSIALLGNKMPFSYGVPMPILSRQHAAGWAYLLLQVMGSQVLWGFQWRAISLPQHVPFKEKTVLETACQL